MGLPESWSWPSKDAQQRFKDNFLEDKIGLTLFQKLRPNNVRLQSSVTVETSLCPSCTNVRYIKPSHKRAPKRHYTSTRDLAVSGYTGSDRVTSLEKEVALLRADVAESNKKLTENNNQLASLISLMSHNKASHNTTGQLSQIQSVPTSPPIMIHTQPPTPNQPPGSPLTPAPTQDPVMVPTLTCSC